MNWSGIGGFIFPVFDFSKTGIQVSRRYKLREAQFFVTENTSFFSALVWTLRQTFSATFNKITWNWCFRGSGTQFCFYESWWLETGRLRTSCNCSRFCSSLVLLRLARVSTQKARSFSSPKRQRLRKPFSVSEQTFQRSRTGLVWSVVTLTAFGLWQWYCSCFVYFSWLAEKRNALLEEIPRWRVWNETRKSQVFVVSDSLTAEQHFQLGIPHLPASLLP